MNLFLRQRFQHTDSAVNLATGGTLPIAVAFLRLLVEMHQLRPAALGAGSGLGCPQILQELDLRAEECVMVGNDVQEDMIARTLGMKVFLLTDCLINKAGEDISQYPHGSFTQLDAYLKELFL